MTPIQHPAGRGILALSLLLISASLLAPSPLSGQGSSTDPFPTGSGMVVADLLGTPINLHFYKPESYDGELFFLLFHGASRTAARYRDNAANMAEMSQALVVVPEFDRERFPNRTYQFGGVFREDGTFAGPGEWTYDYVPELVGYIRTREADPEMNHLIMGFSAGGQFVSRMSAVMDTEAERLVVMSPGSTIFPTRDLEFGLGFGGLPEEYSNDERIRRFLALPITVYIGSNDRELSQLPTGDAYAQGVHRYSRNLHWFTDAMDLAYTREWEFNWRLVIAHGPGHSPADMFNHPQIENALFGHRE